MRPGRTGKILTLAAAGAMAIGATVVGARTGHASSLPLVVNGKHVMWSMGSGPSPTDATSATNNLIYHGGLVETTPAVYIVYWGPEWKSGFSFKQTSPSGYTKPTTFTYTNQTVMHYVSSFFQDVGGSKWAGVYTQYCDNMDPGLTCAGAPFAQYIKNPRYQLKGVWVDPSAVPSTIATTALAENATNDPIATEAIAAAQHFGYNPNATYMIMTQPGITATAYGTVYCAYHGETSHTTGRGVRYAFIPYVPEQGSGCGVNSVNTKDDAFGHGYLDGYSIVAGHEYSEAVTDPDNTMGTQDGWNDVQTNENGDKCAWKGLQNITLAGIPFAVQPTWSNEANGGQGACAVTR